MRLILERTVCDECGLPSGRVVEVGPAMRTTFLCPVCLQKAIQKLTSKPVDDYYAARVWPSDDGS